MLRPALRIVGLWSGVTAYVGVWGFISNASVAIAQGQTGQALVADAAAATTGITSFLQYGVLGLVVVGFITGWIVPGHQAKALAAENARLLGLFEHKLFPLIESSAEALGRASVAMEKSADALNKRTLDEAVEHARDRLGGT